MKEFALVSVLAGLGVIAAGCGSHRGALPPPSTSLANSTASAPGTTTTAAASGPGALQAEANAAAAGDIPDNQAFLVFHNARAGYAMRYPEGWAQQGAGDSVVFRDKNNIIRVVVASGAAPTAATIRRDVAGLKRGRVVSAPQPLQLAAGRAFKVVYSTESTPNAVTGKRVRLVVDRYYLWHGGRRAVVDLGTPQGVDNVDAYRLMIESFRWR